MEQHKTSIRHTSKGIIGRSANPKFSISNLCRSEILWLCDNSAVKSFLDGSSPQNLGLRRWFVFLSQFPLATVHLPGAKNELTDWLSRTEFDSKFCLKFEVESREAFSRMDTQLDLSMKLFPKRNAQFLFKIDFPEVNLGIMTMTKSRQ